MTPTARGPGRTKAEPEPEHDSEHADQEHEGPDTSAQEPQGSGGQKGALVDPSKSTEEVREDQAESYRESEEDQEPSESEKVEQERLEYHQSIQDEIRAEQDTGDEPLPSAEERAAKTAPAPGQVPGDHIPVG